MNIHGFARRAGLVAAVLAASFLVVPSAFARVHVGVGISVPGIAIGVGNCWRCGYPPPPAYYQPGYYQPAYAGPAYYPAPVYYPQPVYYGYGYSAPYYPQPYYYGGYGRGHSPHGYRGSYYRHRGHH